MDSAAIREFDISAIGEMGAAIYFQDQRAWKASDLLLAAKVDTAGIVGWIDAPFGKDHRVRFLRAGADGPIAAYDVVFEGAAKPRFSVSKEPALTANEQLQLQALNTVLAEPLQACTQRPFNHVELKDPKTGEWLVWMLTPWERPEALPFGIHYRFTVSADGNRVVQKDMLAKSCLTMDGRPPPKDDERMMGVAHIASNTPVETHIFTSLEIGRPIMVLTPDKTVWMIDARNHIITKTMP